MPLQRPNNRRLQAVFLVASNARGYPRHARRLLGKPQAPAHPRATPTALFYRPKRSPQRPAPARIADAIPVSSRLIPSALWPVWYDGRGYPNLCAPAAREPSRPAAQISANSKRGDSPSQQVGKAAHHHKWRRQIAGLCRQNSPQHLPMSADPRRCSRSSCRIFPSSCIFPLDNIGYILYNRIIPRREDSSR